MKQKLKKLIESLVFISPDQKTNLIKALEIFSEEKMEKMYKVFACLHDKENKLVTDFFVRNPDLALKAQSVVFETKMSLSPQSSIAGSLSNMDRLGGLNK